MINGAKLKRSVSEIESAVALHAEIIEERIDAVPP